MSAIATNRIVLSVAAIVRILHTIRGTTMVSFVSATEPRLRAGNPFPGLRKVSRVNGVFGFNYEAAVNRQREREGMTPDFVAEPRKWGIRVDGTPIVTHNGKFYIEAKVERSEIVGYIMPDGAVIDPMQVEKWLPARHGGRQAVEKTVILRDFAVENIRSIRMKGNEYVID